MADDLSPDEKKLLLDLARQALKDAVMGLARKPLHLEDLPDRLRQPGATFVTLTRLGELRGCIGALEAYQPLAEDVREHAAAAALQDYRFSPVAPAELPEIDIEISRLTPPRPLQYDNPAHLIALLRPGVDGVILQDGFRRATFLPQVWEKIPAPEDFLDHLCFKMGSEANLWQRKKLQVYVYQVEEFHEGDISPNQTCE